MDNQEEIDGLDYLVFLPGEIINEVISINGNLITNIHWSSDGELIATHMDEQDHLEKFLDKIKSTENGNKGLSPEAKHFIYKSILRSK